MTTETNDVALTPKQVETIAKLLRAYKSLIYSDYEGSSGLLGGFGSEVKRINRTLRELEGTPSPAVRSRTP
jgi:hypothetical protein